MTAPRRLVLAGGGHSHVEVLRQFAMRPIEDLSLTLVTRDALSPYSGMLPGFIAGHYAYEECHVDVRALAQMARARICHAEVTGIDLSARHLLCADRPGIPFDLVSLNIGSRPAVAGIPGAGEYGWPAKPVDWFIRRWQALLADLESKPRPHSVVVAGAGAGGVELALAMHHRLKRVCEQTRVALISAAPDILPSHPPSVRSRLDRVLAAHSIEIHRNETAAEVTPADVVCESGLRIPYDTLVWATHASAPPWLRESGLATDEHGFVRANNALQSISHEFVFAAGDIASLVEGAPPKSGVFAVREGPYLAQNLRLAALGRPLLPYRPQKRHLSLISTGDRRAIASRGDWSAEGAWVWRWKDRIDRKWMERYRYVVPGMTATSESAMTDGEMNCAGCGAKLGHEVLERALARLKVPSNGEVLIGLDAPDDAAVVEAPPGKLAVHSVDFFPPLLEDAYLAGRIAAVHCMSDLYAMGATPYTALAMATLPYGSPVESEDELVDLLAGALSVITKERTTLVGGHTTQGDGPMFGLTVNGFMDPERLHSRRAPIAGDVLVLTKPLGTGVIFAADMRGLAQNDWLSDAITCMTQSNAAAAHILHDHGAAACTDVTGFGLARHLLRLLHQAKLAATLTLADIPTLAGAIAASKLGIRSSLYPANSAVEQELSAELKCKESQTYPLLFDPQTAGGFVAAIPAGRTAACVTALRTSGYAQAAVIGVLRAQASLNSRLHVE